LKNYRGAVEDYEYLLERKSELNPEEVASAYFYKGEAEYYGNNSDQAYLDFKSVVQIDPSNAEAFLYMSYIRVDQGYYEEAITYLDKCLEIDGSNDQALYLRGWCKHNYEIDDLGEADLQRSVDLGNKYAKQMLKEYF
jgi:tetratricopeptide (TPR) repeat protein